MADPTPTPPNPDDHDERDRTASPTGRPTPPRAGELITAAVYEAERETGVHEETEAEVRRSLALRMARMIGGFVLIGIGASLLVLPGPGWIMILIGLSLLPFAWAERTILAIRRRVPGVPEDGTIPTRTWVVIGVVTVGAIVISFLFGSRIGDWISGAWESVFG